jgi:hypothetical protein
MDSGSGDDEIDPAVNGKRWRGTPAMEHDTLSAEGAHDEVEGKEREAIWRRAQSALLLRRHGAMTMQVGSTGMGAFGWHFVFTLHTSTMDSINKRTGYCRSQRALQLVRHTSTRQASSANWMGAVAGMGGAGG